MSKIDKEKKAVKDAFSRIAFWQVMAFVFLACFIFSNEYLDFTYIVFSSSPQEFNIYRLFLLLAVVIVTGIIVIGHTYEKQRSIIKQIMMACSYCHRVKTTEGCWEHVEEHFMKMYPVGVEKVVCPDCEGVLSDIDQHIDLDDSESAKPAGQ